MLNRAEPSHVEPSLETQREILLRKRDSSHTRRDRFRILIPLIKAASVQKMLYTRLGANIRHDLPERIYFIEALLNEIPRIEIKIENPYVPFNFQTALQRQKSNPHTHTHTRTHACSFPLVCSLSL